MKIDEINWGQIQIAVGFVAAGNANRLDGTNWIVYKVGNIIRIDIKNDKV